MFPKISWSYVLLFSLIVHLNVIRTAANGEDSLEVDLVHDENGEVQTDSVKEFEVVTLNQGSIKGFLDKSTKGESFYSFLGVPYAKPPTGSLRFKNPEIIENWGEDVIDGTIPPLPCAQIDLNSLIMTPNPYFVGVEDCLYLNIYTPEPSLKYANLPVLVYIHGGMFTSGSAMDYEPHDLLNNPVVLVVIQYRLGVLGFLSTEDLVMPGNLGLKDQTLALKWINSYIDHFGGSPLKITLFGSGSGAASIHYQIFSHHTIGLFSRAIMQSGNALCPWAKGGVHKEAAYHIGKHFNCITDEKIEDKNNTKDTLEIQENNEKENDLNSVTKENSNELNKIDDISQKDSKEKPAEGQDELNTNGKDVNEETNQIEEDDNSNEDNKDDKNKQDDDEKSKETLANENLLKCLQDIQVDKLAKSAELFYTWSYLPVIFGPYVDGTYLPESPEFLFQTGRHKRLDIIIGINKDDGSHLTNAMFISEARRMALKHHFPLVGPISLEFSDNDYAPLNMTIKAYDRYCGGLNIDASDAHNLTKLFTDRHFGVCADLTADFMFKNNKKYKKNVYFYELTHRGQRSQGDAFGLNVGTEWVTQGDELFYLFPFKKTTDKVPDEDDEKLKEMMLKMWYFFAETGNPTPNGTSEFTWDPYTTENRRHLKLSLEPEMEDDQRVEVREFWESLPTHQNIFLNKEKFMKILNANEKEDGSDSSKDHVKDEKDDSSQDENSKNATSNKIKNDEL